MKEKVRPIYSELQGYLSQAPTVAERPFLRNSSCWDQVNQAIDELNEISEKDYNRFKIRPQNTGGDLTIGTTEYRNKLGGLISRLYGEYFSDEPPPFSGMPSTVITQQQTQSQATYVQILLDVQSKIDEKLRECKENSNEKKFLEKIKSSLSKVGNIVELLALILKTGREFNLTIEQVFKLFS